MRERLLLAVILILMGACFLYGWLVIRGGFSALDTPSALETFAARGARRLALPTSYTTLRNPFPSTPENIHDGLQHFADHCALCHANDGGGDIALGRGLYPKPPDLRLAESQSKTDGEIYYTIENGIRLSGMPAFGEKGGKDDEATWKLVLFIRHLPKLTPEERVEMERFNPKSSAERAEEEEEQRFLRGEPVPVRSNIRRH